VRLATYSVLAVRLANTLGASTPNGSTPDRLTTLDDARALLSEQPGWRRMATPADVESLRRSRGEIRGVFEDAAAGEEVAAVRRLNALLDAAPFHPRLTGHDGEDWHLHLAEGAPTASSGYTAAASVGLATYIAENGFARLGVCLSSRCANVYIDSSTNVSRRYCSDRCATRANVAAYRARRRAMALSS
jgi:predicted RNA-binding Zn ribbon-like protein